MADKTGVFQGIGRVFGGIKKKEIAFFYILIAYFANRGGDLRQLRYLRIAKNIYRVRSPSLLLLTLYSPLPIPHTSSLPTLL
jgi:hypothetical protein